MRQLRRVQLMVTFALVLPCARLAAEDPQAAAATAAKGHAGLHAYAAVDADRMAATRSFDAVLGTSTLIGYGGGVDVTDLWKHLFVRGAVTHATKKGSRAIFTGTEVVSLDIPRTVSMTPIEVGGGWRFGSARQRFVPYAGAAVLLVSYKETTPVPPADPSENVSQTFTGYDAFGGVEFGIAKWIVAGGEAHYRGVPNALGDAALSQAFDETDLGGFTLRFTIGIRTGR
jgi:hypothetical protein